MVFVLETHRIYPPWCFYTLQSSASLSLRTSASSAKAAEYRISAKFILRQRSEWCKREIFRLESICDEGNLAKHSGKLWRALATNLTGSSKLDAIGEELLRVSRTEMCFRVTLSYLARNVVGIRSDARGPRLWSRSSWIVIHVPPLLVDTASKVANSRPIADFDIPILATACYF